MARVIYDGQNGAGPSATAAEDGSSDLLFSGLSFYLGATCPTKDHFRSLITNNGGTVRKTDANAQIYISDHMRIEKSGDKMISYTFIEKSVAKGELENINDHCISTIQARNGTSKSRAKSSRAATAAIAAAIRPQGPQKPALSRSPYTPEEDNILVWFLATYNNGLLSGNTIYKELEAQFGRRSFHSWRDRWLKTVSKGYPNGPEIPRNFDINSVPGYDPPATAQNGPSPSPTPSPTRSRRTIVVKMPSKSSSPVKQVILKPEHAKAIQGYIKPLILQEDRQLIYEELFDKFPEVDIELWEEYFQQQILPNYQQYYQERIVRESREATEEGAVKQEEAPKPDVGYKKQWTTAEIRALVIRRDDIFLEDTAKEKLAICKEIAREYPSHAAKEYLEYFKDTLVPVFKEIKKQKLYPEELEEKLISRLSESNVRKDVRWETLEVPDHVAGTPAAAVTKPRFSTPPSIAGSVIRSPSKKGSPDPRYRSNLRTKTWKVGEPSRSGQEPMLVYSPSTNNRIPSISKSPFISNSQSPPAQNLSQNSEAHLHSASGKLHFQTNTPEKLSSTSPKNNSGNLAQPMKVQASLESSLLRTLLASPQSQKITNVTDAKLKKFEVQAPKPQTSLAAGKPSASPPSTSIIRETPPLYEEPEIFSTPQEFLPASSSSAIPYVQPRALPGSPSKGREVRHNASKRRRVGSKEASSEWVVEGTPEQPPPIPPSSSILGSGGSGTSSATIRAASSSLGSPLALKFKTIEQDKGRKRKQRSFDIRNAKNMETQALIEAQLTIEDSDEDRNETPSSPLFHHIPDPDESDSEAISSQDFIRIRSPELGEADTEFPMIPPPPSSNFDNDEDNDGDTPTKRDGGLFLSSQASEICGGAPELNFMEWIVETAEDFDINPAYVSYALERTSNNRIRAIVVLEEMVKTNPKGAGENEFTLPTHRGIWTEFDDKKLISGNKGMLKALQAQHGEDEVDKRCEWLAEWNTARAELEAEMEDNSDDDDEES